MYKIYPIGGHRGFGCTDSDRAWKYAEPANKPPENTITSIAMAFEKGADCVEIDVARTKDDQVVVIHSSHLPEHVFHDVPSPFIGDLTLEEVKRLRTGRKETGEIPTLIEILDYIARLPAPSDGGFLLNIEIKDVKGTKYPRTFKDRPTFIELLAQTIEAHSIQLERLSFASFAFSDLQSLHSLLPKARLCQLFDAPLRPERKVYSTEPDSSDRYMQFTTKNISKVCSALQLEFLHAEKSSITEKTAKVAAEYGAKINAWTSGEKPPQEDPRMHKFLSLCEKSQLQLGLFTDFIPELKEVLRRK